MRMNFLCQSYLNWLRTRPLESLSTWSQSFELGAHLQDEHLWAESVNPLGTAYEIAYVLVCQELDKKPLTEKSGQLSQSAASRLDESAMRLMFSLCRLNERKLAQKVIYGLRAFYNRHEGLLEEFDKEHSSQLLQILGIPKAHHKLNESQSGMSQTTGLPNSLYVEQPVSISNINGRPRVVQRRTGSVHQSHFQSL